LIDHHRNGLLTDAPTAANVASCVQELIDNAALRQELIRAGYDTARAHTLDAQAAAMMKIVSRELGVTLARVPMVA
jgi:replicative DNA helicase